MAHGRGGAESGAAGALPAGVPSARGTAREAELIVGGVLVLTGAFLYPYLAPVADRVMPPCLFHRLTGLPCLLCGMTRSLAATAHGHLAEAFRMHLLGPPFFLVVAAVTVSLAAERALSCRILPRPGPRGMRAIAWSALGLLAAAWIARLALFGVNV